MDLIKSPQTAEIITKMVLHGVPESRSQYEKLAYAFRNVCESKLAKNLSTTLSGSPDALGIRFFVF